MPKLQTPAWRMSAAAALCLFCACALRAATLYVALDGNNSSGSSWAAAYVSLSAAVNASASGDTILIKQGHYCNTNSAATFAEGLTISGGYFGETPLPGSFTNNPAAAILDAAKATAS